MFFVPEKNVLITSSIQGETSIDFAERVKHEIAKKGGLVELLWDGNLKRNKVNLALIPVKRNGIEFEKFLSTFLDCR